MSHPIYQTSGRRLPQRALSADERSSAKTPRDTIGEMHQGGIGVRLKAATPCRSGVSAIICTLGERMRLALIGFESCECSFSWPAAIPQRAIFLGRSKRPLERLAFEAGLGRVSISQLEREQVNLGVDSLGKIAAALECKIFELLLEPAEGEKTPENLRRGRRS